MKKNIIVLLSVLVLLTSCGTYAGSGAYLGATMGSVFGSAIGGMTNTRNGSDLGTVIGMAAGAAVGGAVGGMADAAVEKRHEERMAAARESRANRGRMDNRSSSMKSGDPSGFDPTNSGDDRIYDFTGPEYNGNAVGGESVYKFPDQSVSEGGVPAESYPIEISKARFVSSDDDAVFRRDELCKVIFEFTNVGKHCLYDLVPVVEDLSANRHILISPSLHVESLMPGKTLRYTALLKSDKRLKSGFLPIQVSVVQGSRLVSQKIRFTVTTSR